MIDHEICADFDFVGCPTVALDDDDIICMDVENSINLCSDGLDNDGDGLIDCQDESCSGSSSCMENSLYTCVDGIDNDGDGLIDCQEAICQSFIVCAEYSVAGCTDGFDNDFDGLIDCADRHRQEILNNICSPSESTLALCSDRLDNDGDGLLDCEDSDCGFVQLQAFQANAIDYVNIIDAICPGNNNGSVELLGQLNSSQYQYSLNGGANQSDPNFVNLDSGSYELTITTLTNCSILFEFFVDGADCTEVCNDGIDNDGNSLADCLDGDCGTLGFSGFINTTNPTCPNINDGTIIIGGANEGFAYEYSVLNGLDYQSSPIFES